MCCPAPLARWKLIQPSQTRFRDRPKTVQLHPGIAFTLRLNTTNVLCPVAIAPVQARGDSM
jgi:hypothetical protein